MDPQRERADAIAGRARTVPRLSAAWRWIAAAILAAAATLAPRTDLAAQAPASISAWLPGRHYFAPLVADPQEIRLGVGLAVTDLFDPAKRATERDPYTFRDPDDIERDLQGVVSLGGTILLWEPRRSADGGVVLGAQAAVFARFRLEEPSRDYTASDWMVALPLELADGPLSARVRLLHRSAHLGDELLLDTGGERIEFGYEALEGIAAYRVLDAARVYGGGAFIFRSNTENEPLLRRLGRHVHDNAMLQAGVDGAWYRWAGGRLGIVAGADWQSAQRTEWRSRIAAVAGIAARGAEGGLRILFRFSAGPSSLGQFFLTDERIYGIEVTAWR